MHNSKKQGSWPRLDPLLEKGAFYVRSLQNSSIGISYFTVIFGLDIPVLAFLFVPCVDISGYP